MRLVKRIWDSIPLPDQVKRLLLIFSSLALVWLFLREQFVPPTFGQHGFYRYAAVDSIKALPISFIGQSACVECHVEQGELKADSYHRTVSCEVCHGAGARHLEDPTSIVLDRPKDRVRCILCHGYNASKPTGFPQIDPLLHNPAEPCFKCHDPHNPKPPHTPEECGACHGQISRTKAVSHHVGLACTFCHETQENHKIDPRSAIPKKPKTREFCGGCHARDAQSAEDIPRVDLESHGNGRLCWQCHYPHQPEGF